MLTGVTEPIEFAFVFLAPMLFVIHSILTGISLAVMYLLDIHLGFNFSAGLIDYFLLLKFATNPWYLFPIGLIVAAIYFVIFDFFIRKYNLMTIGREVIDNSSLMRDHANTPSANTLSANTRGDKFVKALGGATNLINVDACTTRLRLTVRNSANVDKQQLQALGMRGMLAPTTDSLQIIIGPTADIIATEIRAALNIAIEKTVDTVSDTVCKPDHSFANLVDNIIRSLGEIPNINDIDLVALNRLRVSIKDSAKINESILNISNQFTNIHLIHINNSVKQVYLGDLSDSSIAKIYNIIKTQMQVRS